MVTPAVKHEAGDINCLRTVAKRRGEPPGPFFCFPALAFNRKALESLSRQIVPLFSPNCHGT